MYYRITGFLVRRKGQETILRTIPDLYVRAPDPTDAVFQAENIIRRIAHLSGSARSEFTFDLKATPLDAPLDI